MNPQQDGRQVANKYDIYKLLAPSQIKDFLSQFYNWMEAERKAALTAAYKKAKKAVKKSVTAVSKRKAKTSGRKPANKKAKTPQPNEVQELGPSPGTHTTPQRKLSSSGTQIMDSSTSQLVKVDGDHPGRPSSLVVGAGARITGVSDTVKTNAVDGVSI